MNRNSNGLGLNLSKRIANSVLQGDLTLNQEYREGCCFELSMALDRVETTKQSSFKIRGGKQFGKDKKSNNN
jgi:K+-sensing histidine kinase KdpD